MLKVVYGPIQSRRLGRSLGVNLGDPDQKICTWGCLYCQCGFGSRRDLTATDRIPTLELVLHELESAVAETFPIDCVTFAGNSEPMAHPSALGIIRGVKALRQRTGGSWIINCLSNGSELDRVEAINACDELDEAWIKLDCGTEETFRRLNRPVERVESVRTHITRIRKLKRPRIQTLLWTSPAHPKLGNWTEENLSSLLRAYREIQPVEVHITTVDRAPATKGIQAVPARELARFGNAVSALGILAKTFP